MKRFFKLHEENNLKPVNILIRFLKNSMVKWHFLQGLIIPDLHGCLTK